MYKLRQSHTHDIIITSCLPIHTNTTPQTRPATIKVKLTCERDGEKELLWRHTFSHTNKQHKTCERDDDDDDDDELTRTHMIPWTWDMSWVDWLDSIQSHHLRWKLAATDRERKRARQLKQDWHLKGTLDGTWGRPKWRISRITFGRWAPYLERPLWVILNS